MKRFMNKKVAAIGLAAGLVLGLTGAAVAYFTTSGSGTGTVTVGTAGTFSVAEGTVTGDALTPGGATDTVPYTVTNHSEGAENLATVTVSVSADGSTPWSVTNSNGTCSAADFSINGAPAGQSVADISAAADIPGTTAGPGANTSSGSVTIQMVDTNLNQDGCQGLTPPLWFAASS
jgi:hypothetical protein